MEIITEKINTSLVVKVETDVLDAGNTDALKAAISPLLDENDQVLLDLTALTFIDSSGCGALLNCYKQVQEIGGEMAFCQVREPVRTVLELIRLNRLIPFFDARETAAAALEPEASDS